MILDAATFEQVAAVDKILRGVEGMELPGGIKTELFASVFETNTGVCATVAEVDEALPVLRRAAALAAEREGLAIGGGGHASLRAARGAADRQGGALRHVRGLRRDQRPAPGRAGPARARRCAVGRGVLAVPGGDRAVAARRARALGELALVRGSADRHGVEPRAGACRAAARRCAAGVRVVCGVGVVGRAARAPRRDRGLHAHLVGRAPAPEARHARGARCRTSRPTSISPRRSPRCCRRSARPRSKGQFPATRARSAIAAAPTTRRTAGRRLASAHAPSCCIPTGRATCPRRSSRRS